MKRITWSILLFFTVLVCLANEYTLKGSRTDNILKLLESAWQQRSYSPKLAMHEYIMGGPNNLLLSNFQLRFSGSAAKFNSENFAGAYNWSSINHTEVPSSVNTVLPKGGLNSLDISREEGTSYKYSENSSSQLSSVYKDFAVSAFRWQSKLSFSGKWYDEGSRAKSHYFKEGLMPVSFQSRTGITSTSEARGGIPSGSGYNLSEEPLRLEFTTDINIYKAENRRWAFDGQNKRSNGDQLDNLNGPVDPCATPSDLSAETITANSLILNWNASIQAPLDYEVYYGTTATAPTTATAATIANINGLTTAINGLSPNTLYYFWVRSKCSQDDTSTWFGGASFRTLCEAIVLPFVEDFSSTSNTKMCWSVLDGNQDGDSWDIDNVFVGVGVAVIYTDRKNGDNDDWLISPTITLTANQRLKYQYRVNSSDDPNDFRVVLSTSGIDPASFTRVLVPLTEYSNTTYVEETVLLADEEGVPYTGPVNIAWHVPSGGLDGWRLYIDHVTIEDIPSCPTPTEFSVSNVGQTDAALQWIAGSNEAMWEYVISPADTGVPMGNGTEVFATSVAVSGLSSSSSYEAYLRSKCDEDNKGVWLGPISFTTSQIPQSLPYSESFEGPLAFEFTNDSLNKWFVGSAIQHGGSKSLYISNDGGVSHLYTENVSSQVSHAYRDLAIPTGSNHISISFDWKCTGEGDTVKYDYFKVWLVPSEFTPTAGISITTANSGGVPIGSDCNLAEQFSRVTWVAEVTAFAGQNRRLIFEWKNDELYGAQPPAAIDNLDIAVLTCPAPSNLVLNSVGVNTVNVSWTAPVNRSPNYEYYYATSNVFPTGNTPPSNAIAISQTTAALTGLQADTRYYFWVRARCTARDVSYWYGPLSFVTEQVPQTLPYLEDFEGDTGWDLSSNQANHWAIGNAVYATGTRALYISHDNGSSHEYNLWSPSVSHAFRDIEITSDVRQLHLGFEWKAMGEGSIAINKDYFRVWLVPTDFRPVAGTAITAESGGFVVGRNAYRNSSEFNLEEFYVDVAPYSGTSMRLVFEWINDSFEGVQPPAVVDNLVIKKITCEVPTNLTSARITGTNNIRLRWNAAPGQTQWELVIQDAGAGVPGVGATVIPINNTPEYIFTTAVESHLYEYYVRTKCSDSKSFWVGPESLSLFNPPGCANIDIDELNLNTNVEGDYLFCSGDVIGLTLSAHYFDIKSNETYVVEPIEYAPPFPFVGGDAINLTQDDYWSDVIPLGFDFCFFGNSFDKVLVGINGALTFSIAGPKGNGGRYTPLSYCYYDFNNIAIPTDTGEEGPPYVNGIFGVLQDLYPFDSPEDFSVNYQILGQAPCRALVFNIYNAALYNNGAGCDVMGLQTSQIVMYEGTNIIEVYVKRRRACPYFNGGSGLIGIQNADGTVAYTPPGRNTGTWSADNEAWRFLPNGESTVEFRWLKDGVEISSNKDIDVNITQTVTYTAQATYRHCDGTDFVVERDFNFIEDKIVLGTPLDLYDCPRYDRPNKYRLFDNNDVVLGNLDREQYNIQYFLTEEDMEFGNNSLEEFYEVEAAGVEIFVKVTNLDRECFNFKKFKLLLSNPLGVSQLEDVKVRKEYKLPVLAEGESYFTQINGGGTEYKSGALFREIGEHEIFVLRRDAAGCYGQSSFKLEIIPVVIADDLADVVLKCDVYILPDLSKNNKYYTAPGGELGGGEELLPGTEILFSRKLYIYAKSDQGPNYYIDESSFTISYQECPIPKGISPNGDGVNDNLNLSSYGVTNFVIYNRYGKEVFTFKGRYTDQWHGQDNSGKQLPDGTYYYAVEIHGQIKTGWIQINR